MGKNYKIPLPGSTPENGENLHKNYRNCIFGVILPLFWGNFPHFWGSDRGPFLGDFRSIPSKGKNNSQVFKESIWLGVLWVSLAQSQEGGRRMGPEISVLLHNYRWQRIDSLRLSVETRRVLPFFAFCLISEVAKNPEGPNLKKKSGFGHEIQNFKRD